MFVIFLFLNIKCSQMITIITPITNPLDKMGRTINGIDSTTESGKNDMRSANIMGKLITEAVSKSNTAFCFPMS